jgi:hypothetical protein
MARGQPTARTRTWQAKQHVETVSDVFPPVLDELHPIDRAFNTLSIILQAALVTAQAENSRTVNFIKPAFTWLNDCYEWHQEIQQSRDVLQKQMRAKQEEFDVLNTELGQLRDRITLFQEHQRQNAHRNVRELALNIDGDIDHYKSVIVSLNAKVARRDESLVYLRNALAQRTQELVQARTHVEQAVEIASTQMEARIQHLDQVVQSYDPVPISKASCKARVLPVLRASPLRCLQAWAQLAAFRRTQRMVSRRSYLDSVSAAYISWRRTTFPRVGRQSLANRLEIRHLNSYGLALENMAWRDWTRAVFHLSADRLKAWRGDPTCGDPRVTLEARLILAADTKLRTS